MHRTHTRFGLERSIVIELKQVRRVRLILTSRPAIEELFDWGTNAFTIDGCRVGQGRGAGL